MFCGLVEEKVWTTLKNNLSPQTSVSSADQEGKAVLQITYNVTDEQVHNDHLCCTLSCLLSHVAHALQVISLLYVVLMFPFMITPRAIVVWAPLLRASWKSKINGELSVWWYQATSQFSFRKTLVIESNWAELILLWWQQYTEKFHIVTKKAWRSLFVFVQVLSVTSSAEYCEQYVAYACRMSRLLNTPGEVAQMSQLCLWLFTH